MTDNYKEVERFLEYHYDDDTHQGRNYAPYLLDLLRALNWQGGVRSLRDALPYHPSNPENKNLLGLTDFLNVMSSLGYAPDIITIRPGQVKEAFLPCLFVPHDITKTPKTRVLLESDYIEEAGHLCIFSKHAKATDGTQRTAQHSSYWTWFQKIMLRFKGVIYQVLLASFVISILTLATPLFMMSVYDKVIGGYSQQTLHFLLGGIVLAIAVEFTLRLLRTKSLSWFGARIDYIVSNSILERILSLPASYTERASVAAQLSRLKAFESVRSFFTGPLFLAFIELPFVLVLLTALWVLSGALVFIPLTVIALYGILLLAVRPYTKAHATNLANASRARQNMTIETLGKQETLRYAGGYSAWLARLEKASAQHAYAGYRYNQSIAFIDTLSQGLVILGGMAMIYFGVHAIWAGQITMGALIAVLILTWRILAPLQMACSAIPRLDQVKRNVEQINRLMALNPERTNDRSAQNAPHFIGKIEFKNVGLRYSKDDDPVFAGLSFVAQPGQLVAIVGSNSTGKSTTLKLVSGLYHPQAGSIRIDETDIRQIDPVKLGSNPIKVRNAT